MQQRAIKLILAGVSTLAVGIGATSTLSAATSSHGDGISLSLANRAAATAELNVKQDPQQAPKAATLVAASPSILAVPGKPTVKRAGKPTVKRAGKPAIKKAMAPTVIFSGKTKGSYFWDTGHSGNGDTGAPASGLPMQEGCFASPSWPMGTKGYIEYHGKRHNFFICDRGPGGPSQSGVMLDIDGKTYAKLTGGHWAEPDVIGGSGQAGNIPVTYHVTHWGKGPGKGAPQAMG